MSFFKKKVKQTKFYEEEPIKVRFNAMAKFVGNLETEREFNLAVDVMRSIFDAYSKLRKIKFGDDAVDESLKFILHDKEGE